MTEYSYNGWPASPDKNEINIETFGDPYGYPFPGGVRGGDVKTVLGYVASQLHFRVEPCVSGWCWGYSYRANVNNPSTLSCHSSGTAIDWNAPDHANGAWGTFSDAQVGEIRRILDEVGGAVQWGGDYSGTVDEMHFEIIVDAGYLSDVARTLPSGGQPTPEPEPEPEDDEMKYVTLQPDEGPDSGGIWIAGPGFCEVLPSMEYYDTLVQTGVALTVKSVSHRQFDVLKDSFRRFPKLTTAEDVWRYNLTSKVTNAPCESGDMLAYTNLHTEP